MKKILIAAIGVCFFSSVIIVVVLFNKSSSDSEAKTTAISHISPDHTKDNLRMQPINSSSAENLTNMAEVTIEIKDFAYTRSNIKINKGTKVTWVNRDSAEHNVMGPHEGSHAAHDAVDHHEVQEGVLAGPMLAKGSSYSFTFNSVGEYTYHCSPHPNMTGSVTVVE